MASTELDLPAKLSLPVEFFAAGRPRTKGSTRSFLSEEGDLVTKGANPNTAAWQGVVAHAAMMAGVEREDDAAIAVGMAFRFARPKSHYGTGRNAGKLKKSAPKRPTSRSCGDLDKLVRAVLDGLTGIAFNDDSQVSAFGRTLKRYIDEPGVAEGVRITVERDGEW